MRPRKSTFSIIGVLISTSFVVSAHSLANSLAQNSPQDELYLKLKRAKSQDKELTDRAYLEVTGPERARQLQTLSDQNKKNNQAADQEFSSLPEEPEVADGPEPASASASSSERKSAQPNPAPRTTSESSRSIESPKVTQDPLPPTLVFPGGTPNRNGS